MSLKLINIDHAYGKRPALADVNLEIREGDCYGFIGHNGAGKSTAMRIALGLIRPQRGRVIVDGYDAESHPLEARTRMGGLIETPGFLDYWNGPQNLKLLARLQGLAANDPKGDPDKLMELVGLGHVLDLPVRAYSQGMRQRLGIAQALLGHPRYILLDEPGNGLDPEGLAEMRRLLKRLTDEGITVLLSSHQLHEVAEICNRIAVLKSGRVLLEDDAQKILLSGRPLYEFRTQDGARAEEVFGRLELQSEAAGDGVFRVDVGTTEPAQVTRALIEAGVALDSFNRKAPSLEEIYLGLQSPAEEAASEVPTTAESVGPRMAPPRELWRVMRYEWQRLSSRWTFFVLLALPLIVGFWDVRSRFVMARDAAEQVESGTVATTTDVTAFEGVVWGLRTSLLLAALVFCGLASQSLAGELDRGTLRNALLRPVRRSRAVIGKLLTLLGCSTAVYAAVVGCACLASAWYFDFSALTEILPNGEAFPLVEYDELRSALDDAVLAGLLPMLTYTLVGFAAGALARNATTALILSIGGVFAFEFLRVFVPSRDDEVWLPSAHMPSKLGDRSFLRHYEDVVTGLGNATESMAQWPLFPWCLVCVIIALVALSRRDIR